MKAARTFSIDVTSRPRSFTTCCRGRDYGQTLSSASATVRRARAALTLPHGSRASSDNFLRLASVGKSKHAAALGYLSSSSSSHGQGKPWATDSECQASHVGATSRKLAATVRQSRSLHGFAGVHIGPLLYPSRLVERQRPSAGHMQPMQPKRWGLRSTWSSSADPNALLPSRYLTQHAAVNAARFSGKIVRYHTQGSQVAAKAGQGRLL